MGVPFIVLPPGNDLPGGRQTWVAFTVHCSFRWFEGTGWPLQCMAVTACRGRWVALVVHGILRVLNNPCSAWQRVLINPCSAGQRVLSNPCSAWQRVLINPCSAGQRVMSNPCSAWQWVAKEWAVSSPGSSWRVPGWVPTVGVSTNWRPGGVQAII